MRRRLVFALALMSVLWSAGAASAANDTDRFDGRWGVTLVCPMAPDDALPFTFEFADEVRQAIFHAVHGRAGEPGWLSLDGRIEPTSAARLIAPGLTGSSDYNLNRTARGVPYSYNVSACFDPTSGNGNWVTIRTCDFTFRWQ